MRLGIADEDGELDLIRWSQVLAEGVDRLIAAGTCAHRTRSLSNSILTTPHTCGTARPLTFGTAQKPYRTEKECAFPDTRFTIRGVRRIHFTETRPCLLRRRPRLGLIRVAHSAVRMACSVIKALWIAPGSGRSAKGEAKQCILLRTLV